jgi:ATP-dependent DNA ligase
VRDWQRHRPFAAGLRRLAHRLPILWDGTVLDAELIASRFTGTMAALQGSARHGHALRVHVFDVPYLAGADLRPLPWEARRERLELLAEAFEPPYELVPVVTPNPALAEAMIDGRLEGLVLKDRTSRYRDGSRVGWSKVKDRSWYERERGGSIGGLDETLPRGIDQRRRAPLGESAGSSPWSSLPGARRSVRSCPSQSHRAVVS